jgi:hypothetical protein
MSYIQLAEGHRDDAGGPWDEGSWHGVRFRRRFRVRFMILKHACRLHNIEDMERIFRTCCVLHNILLARDGRDNWERLLEDDENVDNTDLLHYAAPVSNNHSFARGERRTYQDREASSAGEDAFVSHTANEAFTARREDLIAHFNVLCERREIELL